LTSFLIKKEERPKKQTVFYFIPIHLFTKVLPPPFLDYNFLFIVQSSKNSKPGFSAQKT